MKDEARMWAVLDAELGRLVFLTPHNQAMIYPDKDIAEVAAKQRKRPSNIVEIMVVAP